MKDGSEEKMMPIFWLHAPSLVSISKSKLKLLSGTLISISHMMHVLSISCNTVRIHIIVNKGRGW